MLSIVGRKASVRSLTCVPTSCGLVGRVQTACFRNRTGYTERRGIEALLPLGRRRGRFVLFSVCALSLSAESAESAEVIGKCQPHPLQ